jgi:hypothetical protein
MRSFSVLLAFTLLYGVFAVALLARQPQSGAGQTADAQGNFEVPASSRPVTSPTCPPESPSDPPRRPRPTSSFKVTNSCSR